MGANRVGLRYYAVLLLAAPVTFFLHEGAHWLAGVALGYDMRFSMNLVAPVGGYNAGWHASLVTIAGPVVTILQAVAAYIVLRRRFFPQAYAFLYFAAFMRFAAMLMTPFNPNDEARLGAAAGLGEWTLPLLIVVLLVFLAWRASRRLDLHWSVNAWSYVVASIGVTAVVMGNAALLDMPLLPS